VTILRNCLQERFRI